MGLITANKFQKLLWPGIRKVYGERDKKFPKEYPEIFSIHTTQQAWEEELGQTGFGLQAVMGEGEAVSYDTQEQGYVARYTPITYGLGFKISKQAYTDGVGAKAGLRKAKALNKSVHVTRETVCANVLNRAFNSSYTMGTNHDGVELCSDLHPNKTGGTYQNELSTASDLSEGALEQMLIDIDSWTDDRGLAFPAQARKLVLPKALRFEAARILETIQQPGNANNDINAIRKLGMIPEGFCINHYLSDADAFFLLTDVEDGLKYFERWKDLFDMDNEWDTMNARFKAISRYALGWSNPKGIFGSPGK